MLRNLALISALVLAVLIVRSNDVQAGGDMSSAEPEARAALERPAYPREQYRTPREQYRTPDRYGYGYDRGYQRSYDRGYGYGYGYRQQYDYQQTYVYGSYYRPYRRHYYSYSYPSVPPYRRGPGISLQGILLPLLVFGIL